MAAPNPEKAVSNSFDYVPVRPLHGFVLDPAACSAREHGLAVAGTSRVIVVNAAGGRETDADGGGREAGRFVMCVTDTGDFSDAEIRTVVHDRGQLYMDVSGRPSIADFAVDVRQLVLAPECRRCPDFDRCCCCYVGATESFFERDEQWVADMMRSLDGAVLDVGLGNVPYMRFRTGEAGSFEYHGVDPDPDAGSVEGVVLHNVGIEDFEGFDGRFDHVLALRSLNHFLDVPAAMAAIRRAMKPGAVAVIMESLALPLVRTRRKAAASHEAAAGGFQHLRNWDSSQLIDVVEGMNASRPVFKVEFHRPIGPDTCDQWIVVLRAI